jgi:hypothetical protein
MSNGTWLLGILGVIFLLLARGDGRTNSAKNAGLLAFIIFVVLLLILTKGCQH